MNNFTELNNKRNELMDEIINIEDKLIPALLKKKREILGKLALTTKKRNYLWVKIKNIHKNLNSKN